MVFVLKKIRRSDTKYTCKVLNRFYEGLWFLFSLLPFSLMYILSDMLFYPFYYCIRYRRQVVRKNLVESLPGKKLLEIIVIEKKFYHFFLDCIFETCKMTTLSEKEVKKRMRFTNIDIINNVLKQGKSVSIYLGHYCNWEWVNSISVHLDEQVVVGQVYRKIRNLELNRLILKNRGRFGAFNVEMQNIVRWIALMRNKVTLVGYIADQVPTWNSIRHWVQFLNHDTPVFTGAEKITRKNHYEAYYLDLRRKCRGYYEAQFILLHENLQSLPNYELTTLYFQQLEKTICRNPEYYLWTHNRFKRTRKEYNKIMNIDTN